MGDRAVREHPKWYNDAYMSEFSTVNGDDRPGVVVAFPSLRDSVRFDAAVSYAGQLAASADALRLLNPKLRNPTPFLLRGAKPRFLSPSASVWGPHAR